MDESQSITGELIPPDLWFHILSFVHAGGEFYLFATVCKVWHKTIFSNRFLLLNRSKFETAFKTFCVGKPSPSWLFPPRYFASRIDLDIGWMHPNPPHHPVEAWLREYLLRVGVYHPKSKDSQLPERYSVSIRHGPLVYNLMFSRYFHKSTPDCYLYLVVFFYSWHQQKEWMAEFEEQHGEAQDIPPGEEERLLDLFLIDAPYGEPMFRVSLQSPEENLPPNNELRINLDPEGTPSTQDPEDQIKIILEPGVEEIQPVNEQETLLLSKNTLDSQKPKDTKRKLPDKLLLSIPFGDLSDHDLFDQSHEFIEFLFHKTYKFGFEEAPQLFRSVESRELARVTGRSSVCCDATTSGLLALIFYILMPIIYILWTLRQIFWAVFEAPGSLGPRILKIVGLSVMFVLFIPLVMVMSGLPVLWLQFYRYGPEETWRMFRTYSWQPLW